MARILLIEGSQTRRRALLAAFRGRDDLSIVQASSFEKALEQLLESPDGAQSWDVVVAGWPDYADQRADELFTLLDTSEFRQIGLLVVAEGSESSAVNFTMQRPRSALIRWTDYSECADAVYKLLTSSREALPPPTSSTDDQHFRVLFVDDSPTVRLAFRRLLMRQGYMVETAADAAEAQQLVATHRFDIAIVDYFMPGENGAELVARLKADPETQHLECAVITGTYSDRVISESLAAGATECVFKNEARELFLARVNSLARTVLNRKSIDGERRRLESILRSVGDGVYGVDRRGRLTFMNPAARDMLGFAPAKKVVGESAHDLFHYAYEDGTPTAVDKCYLTDCYERGSQIQSWPTAFWHEAGRPVPVECTVYPLDIDGRREGSVVAFRDISARRRLEEDLRWQATHDSLTKLLNRAFFETQLEQEIARLKRSDATSALLFVDVDRFKYINDTAGHAAGDQFLIEIAHRLRGRLRASDTLARIGGDEYAVILRNIHGEQIGQTAEEFRRVMVSKPFAYAGKTYRVSGTIGVAVLDRHTGTPSEAMANADIACHLAKNMGRNQIHIFSKESDQRAAMDIELGWSARLEQAMAEDQFVLCFQPVLPTAAIDFAALPEQDGVLWARRSARAPLQQVHFEVLLRLKDSSGDLISPAAFLPTAERFNMMGDIDRWVIRNAFRTLADAQTPAQRLSLSINLSPQSLGDTTLVAFVRDRLVEYRLEAELVTFEISEARALDKIGEASNLISELRELGCRFALDDFGLSLAAFSHLKELDVDYLKIDGQLVAGMLEDRVDRAVVEAINAIAHSIGKSTVAECVDSPALLRALGEVGCDYFQGYYVSRPQLQLRASFGPAAVVATGSRG